MGWDGKVPFGSKGLQHYPENEYVWQEGGPSVRTEPLWVDRYEFKDTLEYISYSRGRSAAYFWFKGEQTDKKYPLLMHDFDKILPLMSQGRITGVWGFVKKGQNFGVKLIKHIKDF